MRIPEGSAGPRGRRASSPSSSRSRCGRARLKSTSRAVEQGAMQVTIDEEGETRVRERFVVSAPVMGRVERIELEPGEPVVRGKTVVARLTPAAAPLIDVRTQAELAAAVEAARAAVGQARAELTRAARHADAGAVDRRQAGDADAVRRGLAATSSRRHRRRCRAPRKRCAPREFAVARAEHELQLARARLRAVSRRRRAGHGRCPGRRRRAEAVAGERVGRAGRRTAARDRRPGAASRSSRTCCRPTPCGCAAAPSSSSTNGAAPQPLEGRVRLVEPSGFMKVSALGVEEQRVNVIIDFAGETGLAQPRRRLSRRGPDRDRGRNRRS